MKILKNQILVGILKDGWKHVVVSTTEGDWRSVSDHVWEVVSLNVHDNVKWHVSSLIVDGDGSVVI